MKWENELHHLCDIHHESQTMLGIEDVKMNKIKSHPSGAQMIREDKQTSNMEKAKGSPQGRPDSFLCSLGDAGGSTLPFEPASSPKIWG